MTASRGGSYSQLVMNGLQRGGAFVVQFRTSTDFDAGRVAGRVEHIASGRTGTFDSAEALVDLLAGMLKDTQTPPVEGRQQQPTRRSSNE
jgi:hypothetical protein